MVEMSLIESKLCFVGRARVGSTAGYRTLLCIGKDFIDVLTLISFVFHTPSQGAYQVVVVLHLSPFKDEEQIKGGEFTLIGAEPLL